VNTQKPNHTVTLSADYPDRPVSWLIGLFRVITSIPIEIIALITVQTKPILEVNTQYDIGGRELRYFFTRYSTTGIGIGDFIVQTAIAALLLPITLCLAYYAKGVTFLSSTCRFI